MQVGLSVVDPEDAATILVFCIIFSSDTNKIDSVNCLAHLHGDF